MSKEVFSADSSALTTAEETAESVTASSLDSTSTTLQFYNGTNADVEFAVSGSRAGDANFTEGVQLSTETVLAGDSAYYVVDEPWDKVEASMTPATNPSTGSIALYRMDSN